jgi:hypothetical protein
MPPTLSVSFSPLLQPLLSFLQRCNRSLLTLKLHILAFSFGTTLINQGHADAGQIINVILAILIGSFSLALMAPELQGTNLFSP